MIEVTDEMIDLAFRTGAFEIARGASDRHAMRRSLAAVLAIVERDHDVRRLTPTVGREHVSADEFGIIRCHTPGPDGVRCERTPEHRGLHAHYGYSGAADELARW